MAVPQVIEGIWEEILRRASEFVGTRLRVTILEKPTSRPDDDINPNALEETVAALVNRSPEEKAAARARLLQQSRPPQPIPDGQTLADVVCGQWPGNESEEQVFAALTKLS